MKNKELKFKYFEDSHRRLRSARASFNRMGLANNADDFAIAFHEFLEFLKYIFQPLEKTGFSAEIDDYKEWDREMTLEIINDPYIKFFWDMRNEVVKSSKNIIFFSFSIIGQSFGPSKPGEVWKINIPSGTITSYNEKSDEFPEPVKNIPGYEKGVAKFIFNELNTAKRDKYINFDNKEILPICEECLNRVEKVFSRLLKELGLLNDL